MVIGLGGAYGMRAVLSRDLLSDSKEKTVLSWRSEIGLVRTSADGPTLKNETKHG